MKSSPLTQLPAKLNNRYSNCVNGVTALMTKVGIFTLLFLSSTLSYSAKSIEQVTGAISALQQLRQQTQLPIKNTMHLPKSCFTQGFTIDEAIVYLSCGQYNQSKLYRFQLINNKLLKKLTELTLPNTIFAEGMTVIDQHIFLLSWKSQLLFKFNKHKPTLQTAETFTYYGQGWGLTQSPNQHHFLYSNGSHIVQQFTLGKKAIEVTARYNIVNSQGRIIDNINELETIRNDSSKALVFNRWHDHQLYVAQLPTLEKEIKQAKTNNTPQVKLRAKTINLKALAQLHPEGVINGVAFNSADNTVWITGKNWGLAYQFNSDDLFRLAH